jgi:hypothetical protein
MLSHNDNDQVLCESSTLRTNKLALLGERSEEILSKAKAIHFNVWQGVGAATTEQVAEFYEVPLDTVKSVVKYHRSEFDADGLKVLAGKELSSARLKFNLANKARNVTIWNPRSTLRLGYLLRDSAIAKAVRTTSLDIVENLPVPTEPIQPQRQLAPQRDLLDYLEAAKSIGIDQDPILLSLFSQRMAEQLGGKVLAPAQQVILTVRAAELGYHQSRIGNGSQLGKFVSKMIAPNGKTQHGRYPVNVYDLTPELDQCIHTYFR